MASVKITSSDKVISGLTHSVVVLALDASGDPQATAPKVMLFDQTADKYLKNMGGGVAWVDDAAGDTFDTLSITGTSVGNSAWMVGSYKVDVPVPAGDRTIHVYVKSGSGGATKVDTQALTCQPKTIAESVGDMAFSGASGADTVLKVMGAVRAFTTGNQNIDDATKKLVIYQSDGETAAMTFDLKDASGLSSAREVWKKEIV